MNRPIKKSVEGTCSNIKCGCKSFITKTTDFYKIVTVDVPTEPPSHTTYGYDRVPSTAPKETWTKFQQRQHDKDPKYRPMEGRAKEKGYAMSEFMMVAGQKGGTTVDFGLCRHCAREGVKKRAVRMRYEGGTGKHSRGWLDRINTVCYMPEHASPEKWEDEGFS